MSRPSAGLGRAVRKRARFARRCPPESRLRAGPDRLDRESEAVAPCGSAARHPPPRRRTGRAIPVPSRARRLWACSNDGALGWRRRLERHPRRAVERSATRSRQLACRPRSGLERWRGVRCQSCRGRTIPCAGQASSAGEASCAGEAAAFDGMGRKLADAQHGEAWSILIPREREGDPVTS